MNFKSLLKSLLGEESESVVGSIAITDQSTIENYISDAENTFLVSFPRTGSHWLRMIMELYFKRPSLVRVFYYPECTDYLTLHTHDMDLDVTRSHVIYLYRDTIDTIYSQLRYYGEDINDTGRVKYWSDIYGHHLTKWLLDEDFTVKKTIVKYERMLSNIQEEFKKVCDHFSIAYDSINLEEVVNKVSKKELKKKTLHDLQVVNLTSDYQIAKDIFRDNNSDLVLDCIFSKNVLLKPYFDV